MFCSKCGTEISDESMFCSNCGAALTAETTAQSTETSAQSKGLQIHCPRCGSTKLQVTQLEVKNIFINTEIYWHCSDCGMKFRDLDNLENEITQYEKTIKIAQPLIFIALIIGTLFMIILLPSTNIIFRFICLIPVLLSLFLFTSSLMAWATAAGRLRPKKREYDDLFQKIRRS